MGNSFESIASIAEKMRDEHRRVDGTIWLINALLIPATMGVVKLDTDDLEVYEKTAMPDEWLGAVAELPNISQNGLQLLTSAIQRKGWVSIADAIDFIERETKNLNAQQAKDHEPGHVGHGAAKLLARADRELPGTIARFTENAKNFTTASLGVAEFAVQKAIWSGKALGGLARMMKSANR